MSAAPTFFVGQVLTVLNDSPKYLPGYWRGEVQQNEGGNIFWDVNMMVSTDIRQSKKGVGIKLVYPE